MNPAESSTVNTPHGPVALMLPSLELVRTLCHFLPFGVMGFTEPDHGAIFGIVMQRGARELYAVKQQSVEFTEEEHRLAFGINSFLIAHSLAGYLAHRFSGLFMPCAYFRSKESGLVEVGFAYFGYPSAEGLEAQPCPIEPNYDGRMGHGFTLMMMSFMAALGASAGKTGLPIRPYIGLEVRSRLQLENLGFGFLVVGPHVVCLKTHINEQDPVWEALRRTGITEVYHLPSVPIAIEEDRLPDAKLE